MSNTNSSRNAAAADQAIFSGATSTKSSLVLSTTGSSRFAGKPAMIFRWQQATDRGNYKPLEQLDIVKPEITNQIYTLARGLETEPVIITPNGPSIKTRMRVG